MPEKDPDDRPVPHHGDGHSCQVAEEGRGHRCQRGRSLRGGDGQGHHGLRVHRGRDAPQDPPPRGRPGEGRRPHRHRRKAGRGHLGPPGGRGLPAAAKAPAAQPAAGSSPPPPARRPAGAARARQRRRGSAVRRVRGRVKSSPLARKLAAEKGIDLRSVRGSGPEGRIVKRDLEALPRARVPRAARRRRRDPRAALCSPARGRGRARLAHAQGHRPAPLRVHVHRAPLLPHGGRRHGRAPGGAHAAERGAREEDFRERVPHGHRRPRARAASAGQLHAGTGTRSCVTPRRTSAWPWPCRTA